MLTSCVEAFGLAKLNVSVDVPPRGAVMPEKTLETVGASGSGVTVRVAVLLVAPCPLSFADIAPLVLLKVPVAFASTRTEMKHSPSAGGVSSGVALPEARRFFSWPVTTSGTAGAIVPPVNVIAVEPAVAVTVPRQLLNRPFGLATCIPDGSASVNDMPVSDTSLLGAVEFELGFVISKLNRVG